MPVPVQAPGHTLGVDLSERRGSSTRHPWELARAEFFLRLLERRRLLEDAGDWLDAGAGDAWFATQLRERLPAEATITCWDVNYTPEDIQALRELDAENVTYVAERPAGRFDRILLLDVIEHVEDDVGFVAGTVRDLLRDDGLVLVSVPAYQSLWSSHDRTLQHHRRYSPAGCRGLLERAGLAVLANGGLFFSLLPVRIGGLLIERVRPVRSASEGIGSWSGGRVVTTAITRVLSADGRFSLALSERGVFAPGLSYWALCRPSGS